MSPCVLKLLTVGCLLGFVFSDNSKNALSRQPKVLTFNTDSEDVEVSAFYPALHFEFVEAADVINAVALAALRQ